MDPNTKGHDRPTAVALVMYCKHSLDAVDDLEASLVCEFADIARVEPPIAICNDHIASQMVNVLRWSPVADQASKDLSEPTV